MRLATAGACPRILSLTLAREHELRLGWLDALPQGRGLCVSLCLKGMRCGGGAARRAVAGLRRVGVHSCVEEPGGNENGHEGVCAFRFLLDNYDAAWEGVYFLHGDMPNRPMHAIQFADLRRFLARDRWPPWPARGTASGAISDRHCGCGKLGSSPSPFGPRDFWFDHITWWLGTFLRPADAAADASLAAWERHAECRQGACSRAGHAAYPLHNGSLYFPAGFMFAIDRAAALRRSRAFLEAQYRLCRVGVRALPPGTRGAGRAIRVPPGGFDFNPLIWGHVNDGAPEPGTRGGAGSEAAGGAAKPGRVGAESSERAGVPGGIRGPSAAAPAGVGAHDDAGTILSELRTVRAHSAPRATPQRAPGRYALGLSKNIETNTKQRSQTQYSNIVRHHLRHRGPRATRSRVAARRGARGARVLSVRSHLSITVFATRGVGSRISARAAARRGRRFIARLLCL